jgi:flagellar basal body P-ring formation protein FlgA
MIRLTSLFLLAVAVPALAQSFQDTKLLDKAVAGFTGHATGEEGGARTPVDPRLKLASCPMVAMAWHTDRHDAVVVSCPAPQWRIFVAIRQAPPPVVTPQLPAPGTTPASKPVVIIKRGDPVTIVTGSDGFSVTRDGVAMGDAAAGARVAVQVEQGKPPIQAIAVEPGKVTLPGAQ